MLLLSAIGASLLTALAANTCSKYSSCGSCNDPSTGCAWCNTSGFGPHSGAGFCKDPATPAECISTHQDTCKLTEPPRSFFIIFGWMIDSPEFPSSACGGLDCGKFDLFVVQPLNVTSAHVAKLRAAGKPGSRVLAYFDTIHVPIRSGCATGHSMGDYPGKTCHDYKQCGDGPYLQGLREVFPPSMADRNASDDYSVVCTYPGLADHVPHSASIDALAPFLAKTTVAAGFDGLYLDNRLSPALFARGADSDKSVPGRFDHGAVLPGLATTSAAAVALYTGWSPVFTYRIRQELDARRPHATNLIVGNSAGALSDPSLNGLTIEMEACVRENCTDAILAQAAVAQKPNLGVFWLTHSESMPPAEQCARVKKMQAALPWMRAGTDFIDLSHIVCNDTDSSVTV
jgi:hypothetical protein